jgi:hypothetical protein
MTGRGEHNMDDRALNEKASEETLISLLQLDPSPIESPQLDKADANEKQLPPLPSDADEEDAARISKSSRTGASTTSSLGLSGTGGHGAIYYCSSTLLPWMSST